MYNCRKDEELVRLLRSYTKQVSINAMKKIGAMLLGLAKYIYITSNRTEITRMISDQIKLHSTQFNNHYKSSEMNGGELEKHTGFVSNVDHL